MRIRPTRGASRAWLNVRRKNKTTLWNSFLIQGISLIASWAIRLFRFSWRVRLVGPKLSGSKPNVFCFWHGRQAGLFAFPTKRPVAVLSSLSRDGSIQAGILRRLGFDVYRGSTSRGGATGLKRIISAILNGADGAFAVDGPRGPAFRVKNGAIVAAKKTSAYLVPITTKASAYWSIKGTWDDYQLPKPFSRVTILCGNPISSDGLSERKLMIALNEALDDLEQ